jgi:hypothetical protein
MACLLQAQRRSQTRKSSADHAEINIQHEDGVARPWPELIQTNKTSAEFGHGIAAGSLPRQRGVVAHWRDGTRLKSRFND